MMNTDDHRNFSQYSPSRTISLSLSDLLMTGNDDDDIDEYVETPVAKIGTPTANTVKYKDELQNILKRSKGTPYENSLRRFVEAKFREMTIDEIEREEPSKNFTIKTLVNQSASYSPVKENNKISVEKLAEMARPLERAKWRPPSPNRVTTNHLGRQRPAPNAVSLSSVTSPHLVPRSPSPSKYSSQDFQLWLKCNQDWKRNVEEKIRLSKLAAEEEDLQKTGKPRAVSNAKLTAAAQRKEMQRLLELSNGWRSNPKQLSHSGTGSSSRHEGGNVSTVVKDSSHHDQESSREVKHNESDISMVEAAGEISGDRILLEIESDAEGKQSKKDKAGERQLSLSTDISTILTVFDRLHLRSKLTDASVAPEEDTQQSFISPYSRKLAEKYRAKQSSKDPKNDLNNTGSSRYVSEGGVSTPSRQSRGRSRSTQRQGVDLVSQVKEGLSRSKSRSLSRQKKSEDNLRKLGFDPDSSRPFEPSLMSSQSFSKKGSASFAERNAKSIDSMMLRRALASRSPSPGPGHYNTAPAIATTSSPRQRRNDVSPSSGSKGYSFAKAKLDRGVVHSSYGEVVTFSVKEDILNKTI